MVAKAWRFRLRVAVGLACLAMPPARARADGGERFCVQHRSGPLSCLYVDPGACQAEADRVDGLCEGNAARLGAPPGEGAFCLAEGSAIVCDRDEATACSREARRVRGACIARWSAQPAR